MRRGPREPEYKRGDFYRVDDRTGFKVRASEQKEEWTNLIVDERYFEYRHPQDFVTGKKDDQTVPDARPRIPDTFVGGGPNVLELVDGVNFVLLVNGIDMIDLVD